jgi:hypothetical protein
MYCDVQYIDGANRINPGANLWSLQAVKQNGGGQFGDRGTQDNFEVVLEN